EDDLEIFRSIRNRLALSEDVYDPLSLKPLCTLPPNSSDEDAEDDFETLRIIQKRFLAYSTDCKSLSSLKLRFYSVAS
ncbi:hypothetical protein Goari_007742, partial [Gossypium aridum]|nr:hypothetical protein [Gossypium aridum]